MGVYVYVDGFNYYYRLFKNSRRSSKLPPHYKWLDLLKLSELLMPGQNIDRIGYFTAYVKQNNSDPEQHLRQRAYIEALRTIPCLEVIPGNFQPAKKWGIPSRSSTTTPVEFDTFEEKGSDVNLASRLVWDASQGMFSEAMVISNDSDLREAVRIVTTLACKPVHIRSPDLTVSNALRSVAASAIPLDTKLFKRCQFPETLTNAAGIAISRPADWAPPSLPTKS